MDKEEWKELTITWGWKYENAEREEKIKERRKEMKKYESYEKCCNEEFKKRK